MVKNKVGGGKPLANFTISVDSGRALQEGLEMTESARNPLCDVGSQGRSIRVASPRNW